MLITGTTQFELQSKRGNFVAVDTAIVLGESVPSPNRHGAESAGVGDVEVDLAVPPGHGLVPQHLPAGEALVPAVLAPLVHRLKPAVQV